VVVVLTAASGAAKASAGAADIEGVWSFERGAVGVQALSDGSLQGTVLSPTTFGDCPHPIGQVMWTAMRPRPDGSYLGFHQWYLGTCEVDPELGLTAWRVLTGSDGSRSLEVCFTDPGLGSEPQIAADGSANGATYGCSTSAPLGPLPGTATAGSESVTIDSFVSAPDSNTCVSHGSLNVLLHRPRYDPLRELVVRVKGAKVAELAGKALLKRSFRLEGLPEGTFRVKLLAVTVLGQRYRRARTYRACTVGPRKIHTPGGRRHKT
jgi:hypothetical protein